MTRALTAATIAAAAIFCVACRTRDDLPTPVPAGTHIGRAPGFPIKARPPCSAEVTAARDDETAVLRAAAHGANFTCGGIEDPLPLDVAVLTDAPARVRALLAAHADPNARWSSNGDRFPLQEAIEARSYGRTLTHRLEIIGMLLQHGADPNARWCPFETRGGRMGCTSAAGVTPLIMAAARDDAELMSLLKDAGADLRLKDFNGDTALNPVHSRPLFHLQPR